MRLAQLVFRNSLRSPLRTLMTVLTVGMMLAAFVFPRALVDQQDEFVREAPNDRVIVLPRRNWDQGLPRRYADEIRAMSGIHNAAGVRHLAFKLPGNDDVFFGSNAVEPVPFMAMHRELVAPDAQKQAFLENERSVLVSRELARERGWNIGDRLTFESHLDPGKWEVTVAGVYDTAHGQWGERMVWAHYGFVNRGLSPDKRDRLGFVTAQVSDRGRAGSVARAFDLHFEAEVVPTLSMENDVLAAASVGRIAAVLDALDFISVAILFVVMAILMNTLSLNLRERTQEFGLLRAFGFEPRHIWALVLGEAGLLGLAGSAVGVGMSYALLEGLVGPYLQERLQFQEMKLAPHVALTGFAAGLALALLAAIPSARRMLHLEVRDALSKVS
jgi:putative ABC transport system permease protein